MIKDKKDIRRVVWIESGELMALMGGLGSGKTTLLNLHSLRANARNK